VSALKRQLIRRLKKARVHHRSGQEAEADGRWVAAASSYYLAHQYDPRSADYEADYRRANGKARTIQAARLVQLARNAEDYGSHREAIVYYQKACELDPPEGEAFYRLGVLLRRLDPEDRTVLDSLRAAVVKTGTRAEYRLALAEVYEATGMKLNAHREYQAALKLEPGNDTAKSGARRTR
jgi:tetratricopeptide (TPR) repeat protein